VLLANSDLADIVGIAHLPSIPAERRVIGIARLHAVCFSNPGGLQLEIIALGHQLGVMQRSVKKPKLNRFDRFLWAWFCGAWAEWRSALCIVKPETVIAWHRKGFRLFWSWKVRRGQPGRPPVSKEIRKLIRRMSRENPLWGAPRIHGELLKLGIDIGETCVSKYMVRRLNPSSQTWRTFLENHPNIREGQSCLSRACT